MKGCVVGIGLSKEVTSDLRAEGEGPNQAKSGVRSLPNRCCTTVLRGGAWLVLMLPGRSPGLKHGKPGRVWTQTR